MRLRRLLFILLSISLCLGPLSSSLPGRASPLAELPVYGDALDELWQNWSWGTTVDFAHGSIVQNGNAAIEVTYNEGWVALFLHSTTNLDSSTLKSLRFAMHGGAAGGQQLLVRSVDQSGNWGPENLFTVPANQWQNVEISLEQLGLPASISGLVFQNGTGGPQPTLYLDNIELVTKVLVTDVALTVDLNGPRHPINPDIYGINFADQTFSEQERSALGLPVNRWGGNGVSRYNYQADISSAASDWYYVNTTDDTPASNGADLFITTNQNAGTDTLMTIPMLGWVAKDPDSPNCGFPTSVYGAQQFTINWGHSGQSVECGNGIDPAGNPITPDAANANNYNQQVDEAFVQGWINQLVGTYGNAANGGVKYYSLDNEPMLWSHTHRDLHPNPASYDEVRDLSVRYGAAVKQADPTALVTGPALWGWPAYEYSALDMTNNFADRQAHGNVPFAEWYLQQMKAHEQATGVRILDYLDIHYYPQNYVGADSHPISLRASAGDAAEQAMRLRSVRSLWDPTYTDETWINTTVQLIPRAQGWIANNYPDTHLAITEYNFGGYGEINGALVQADVLGVFGQEALDMAVMWKGGDQVAGQPWEYAFQLFRNYDGSGSRFGNESIDATSTDLDLLSIYAAERSSDGALTMIVINKSNRALSSNVALNGLSAGSAEVWRYNDNGNLNAIAKLADQAVNNGGFTASFPAETITLFVVNESSGSGPTATNTPVPQPTATDTPVSGPTATNTPEPLATDTPTSEPLATDTPTSAPTSINTPEPIATDTPVSAPTATNTPEPTATAPIIPTATSTPAQPAGAFIDTFDGDPSAPLSWRPDGWDVAVHSRDVQTQYQLEPMKAAHGSNCEPPPATHLISAYEDAVYQCKNHLMTAIQAEGYGMIYLTPNQMADFSQGEAVIRFDISTERTSSRDWWDIWITPYEHNLQLPLEAWLPDLQGPPKQAVHVRLDQDNKVYAELFDNHNDTRLFPQDYRTYDEIPGFEPSARNRSTFELRISETHLKFGMPDHDLWWIDTDISALGWDSGVVQLGHHSYNPTKCDGPPCSLPQQPNTWHWDNVSIAPSQPFTIIGANQRYITDATGATITFDSPAPDNAHARFSAFGENLEVSFDGGATWEAAQMPSQPLDAMDHATSYFTPIPAGVTTMMVRGDNWYDNGWFAKDFAIWSADRTTPPITSSCWPNGLPSGAIPGQPDAIFCAITNNGADTSDSTGNSWMDTFDHGLSFATFDGTDYRLFDGLDVDRSEQWRHADHWMVDIAPDSEENSAANNAVGAAMLSPNRTFRFENGSFSVDTDYAAGHPDYGPQAWGEIIITTSDHPVYKSMSSGESTRRDLLYGYDMFPNHWALGCRLQAEGTTICSLMKPNEKSAVNGGREWEMSFFQQVGSTNSGGFSDGQSYRFCEVGESDGACRDRFRLELTQESLTIYANGVEYFKQTGLPPLPDEFVNADLYVYLSSNVSQHAADTVRFHWDEFAVNNPNPPSAAPGFTMDRLDPPKVKPKYNLYLPFSSAND